MRLIMFNTLMGVAAGGALLLVPHLWAVLTGHRTILPASRRPPSAGGWAAAFHAADDRPVRQVPGDFAVRLLSLTVTGLAAALVGTNASWIAWVTEPSIGRALAAGCGTFAATVPLVFGALNHLMRREA